MIKLGILHPGQMGISVAASALNSGCKVYWASENRSEQTRKRADEHNLEDVFTLENLCSTCNAIISICPPDAAENVADQVIATGFKGIYLDANAIAPQRSLSVGEKCLAAGIDYVDGSIIGGPAWEAGRTWLYLSGSASQEAMRWFSSGPIAVSNIGEEIGKASALKMCFAAYTKGTTALLSAILAAAQELGVRSELENQWSRNGSDFAHQTHRRVRNVTQKAWRFEGEMMEIAATLSDAGLPGGFHTASAEIYNRLADFKGHSVTPDLDDVLDALVLKS